MARARAFSLGLTFAVALTGCKPTGTRDDAGLDARAGSDAAALEAGAGSSAARPDAATLDDGLLPAATSDELNLRAQHLFEAILRDNPDLASDIVFPRDAFEIAHDATDPGKVWDAKIVASFRRGIHTLHVRTKGIERAQFLSFEIGRTVTQVTPRRHDWKFPLWHVLHARLTYLLDGHTARLDIGELTSWRGAWYVTKLR